MKGLRGAAYAARPTRPGQVLAEGIYRAVQVALRSLVCVDRVVLVGSCRLGSVVRAWLSWATADKQGTYGCHPCQSFRCT